MGALLRQNLFGLNVLSIAGLCIMGFGLTMRRMAGAGAWLCFGVMSAGTVLVLLGLYADHLVNF